MPKRLIPAPWRLLTAIGLVVLAAATTYAQTDVVQQRMKKDIEFLASPECEGRGVGSKGIDIAADYIINQITQAGIKPAGKDGTWFQPFTIGAGKGAVKGGTSTLILKGPLGQSVAMQLDKDFQVLPGLGSGKVDAPLVFAGYGVSLPAGGKDEYDDFKDQDVKGKIVVVLRRVPRWDNDAAPFAGDKNEHAGLQKKIATAEKNGAAAVLVVNDRSEAAEDKFTTVDAVKDSLKAAVPVAQLRRGVLDMMLTSGKGSRLADLEKDIDRDLKPRSGPVAGWTATLATTAKQTTIACKNIIGVLEGSGPLANETIVVGAHYDHLGNGLGKANAKMYPGADDNGSGSTTIMELARRFGAIKDRQGRRLVFIWFSAEERGLLGSQAYCREPIFPLENTAAMMNLDMVGRLKDEKAPVIYAEGFNTGKGLKELLDKLNEEFGFTLKGPHPQNIYGRSDQASFYRKNVPGMFFFTDFHSDYHKPGDTADKINVAGMAKVAALTEKLVGTLTTMPVRPEYVAGAIKAKGGGGAGAKATPKLSLTPDATDKADNGVLVDSVTAGGAAAKAGILAGDRITAIGGTPTPNVNVYLTTIRQLQVGSAVEVTLIRKGMELKLKITPE